MATAETTIKVNVEVEGASVTDPRLIEIIMRYDRLRRVEDIGNAQAACGRVALPVQYVEDMGHLMRLLGVALPRTL